MSIHKVYDPTSGLVTGYKVRWRDTQGSSRRRTVKLWRDAIALDAEIKRKKVMGELITHEKGKIKLCDFWEIWLKNYASTAVTPRTLDVYSRLWSRHVNPVLGGTQLRGIDREQVAALVSSLSTSLKPSSTRKALAVLQSVLGRAVEWGYITTNPASGIRKPRLVQRQGIALTSVQVAALCAELDLRSSTLVRVLSGSGLRPGELRALTWSDVSDGSLAVTKAVSNNEIGPTKTNRLRSVEPTRDAAKALAEWRLASGPRAPGDPVVPGADGRIWTDDGYRMWVKQVFKPAAARAGLSGLVPYDLRHTFASQRIAEGADILTLAAQLGHSPTMTLTVYGHLLGQKHGEPEARSGVRSLT